MQAAKAAIWDPLCHYLNSSETRTKKPKKKKVDKSNQCLIKSVTRVRLWNSNAFDALESRKPILGNVMEALADPDTHLIGVYGLDDEIKDTLLQRVYRRIQKDNLFDLVLTATVTRKPDVKKVQDELASQLGFTFRQKSIDKRANELIHRIKKEHKILIVLCDLYERLDLGKVGIPYGIDHTGCEILITSTTEDVLSNHMHTQKSFMV
ncbi:probable disease resistance protein At1g61300 [Neltuma alba]|uniref:probable disease resistance protein At1g61300 n=1 Tax=Neltuma alba TaxID=207710 RepID=UPI0010A3CF86|nr:probable disease resistance protein At1g61300 [Prosopis alba]XP_028783334.1 probable disease resistance protein At1g61300 [Prosopis alba]